MEEQRSASAPSTDSAGHDRSGESGLTATLAAAGVHAGDAALATFGHRLPLPLGGLERFAHPAILLERGVHVDHIAIRCRCVGST